MTYDVLVIGCGVVGAATAYELSKYNLKVLILEKENDVAEGATKANSAIIHAGYDPRPGTLMARLNVRGTVLAEEICRDLDVPYKKCGSLVVAFSEEEMPTVRELYERGLENGVPGMKILTGEEVRDLEPNLSEKIVGALYAPSAAICSPWEYCLAMAETAVKNSAELRLETKVTGVEKTGGGWLVKTDRGEFETKYVVNAAGVHCGDVHNMAAEPNFEIEPARGEYYLLDKSEGKRVGMTVFQCPSKLGKGVLVSPTVHGNLIVGPNAEPAEPDDTSTTASGLKEVSTAALRSVPGINFRDSIRNFAGVRANNNRGDFIIQWGAEGFLDLAGICSPGLSAAPAIGEYAAELLREAGLEMVKKDSFISKRKRVRFKELSSAEKAELIKKDPSYGRVICRCETVTEGEILACLKTPVPPKTVDGVKRRVNAGMGRCQGGFCGPRVVEILSREYGIDSSEVLQDKKGTWILSGKTKGESENV